MPTTKQIEAAYKNARERYESLGVNADKACAALAKIPVSLHCWQGDDVGGFENQGGAVGGGLAVTQEQGEHRLPRGRAFGAGLGRVRRLIAAGSFGEAGGWRRRAADGRSADGGRRR